MAGEDDDMIVVNLSDAGDGDDGLALGGGADKPGVITKARASDADDPVSDLRGQLASMQTNLQQANQRAVRAEGAERAAQQEIVRVRAETVDSQMDTIESGLSAVKARGDVAEQAYATAMDAGDYKAAAKHQREMAAAESEAVQLKGAKVDLEAQRKTAPADAADAKRPAAANVDPVEAYLANRTEPTKNWLRQHPEFVTDTKKNAKLTAAHWDAVGSDLAPDSPEYFKHVEKFIGVAETKAGDSPRTTQQRRPSATVAPVQADSGGQSGGNGGEVKLTRGEAQSATDGTLVWNYDDPTGKSRFKKGDPIGLQEMARRKIHGIKNGLYDKSLTE